MAILQRTVNGSFTEIYIGGGNGWITQSAPTNFHSFWKQKILTGNKTPEDFREVTDKEKAALEKSDAKWEKPSEDFIAQMAALGVTWNADTGFFELNTLVDIGYREMINIYQQSLPYIFRQLNKGYGYDSYNMTSVRTFLPMSLRMATLDISYNRALEVLKFETCFGPDFKWCFNNALRKIIGAITAIGNLNLNPLPALEDVTVKLINTTKTVSLQGSPNLSLASLQYMVDKSKDVTSATVTLHPDAYARLTEELIAAAAEKNIVFATT